LVYLDVTLPKKISQGLLSSGIRVPLLVKLSDAARFDAP
jgi:hypothetical protein